MCFNSTRPVEPKLNRVAVSNPDIAELCRVLDIFDQVDLFQALLVSELMAAFHQQDFLQERLVWEAYDRN